jgi:hypothetical protein
MTYPRLPAAARPIAAACFRQVRQRLAYVRAQERALPPPGAGRRSGGSTFRDEMVARTCERRETRLQLQAMRQLLHALCG